MKQINLEERHKLALQVINENTYKTNNEIFNIIRELGEYVSKTQIIELRYYNSYGKLKDYDVRTEKQKILDKIKYVDTSPSKVTDYPNFEYLVNKRKRELKELRNNQAPCIIN